jgi:site-specific DNA recombinase
LIELAHGAKRLFAKHEPLEKHRLLNFVRSNSTWRKNGELTATFRQPFDLLAKATALASGREGGGALNSPGHPVWLGDLDSNQD